jgi:hypothetical protein
MKASETRMITAAQQSMMKYIVMSFRRLRCLTLRQAVCSASGVPPEADDREDNSGASLSECQRTMNGPGLRARARTFSKLIQREYEEIQKIASYFRGIAFRIWAGVFSGRTRRTIGAAGAAA